MENKSPKIPLFNRRNAYKQSAAKIIESKSKVFELQKKLFFSAVSVEVLLSACRDLTPGDYDVVVIERNSEDLCGFPLCGRCLKEARRKIPHLKLREKVYGISNEGNFCSSECLLKSEHLKGQLCEEPLYLRPSRRGPDIFLLGEKRDNGERSRDQIKQDVDSDVASINVIEKYPVSDNEAGCDPRKGSMEAQEEDNSSNNNEVCGKEGAYLIEGAHVGTRSKNREVDENSSVSSASGSRDFNGFDDDEVDPFMDAFRDVRNYNISLFGRLWHLISSMVTDSTVNFLTDHNQETSYASKHESELSLHRRDILCKQVSIEIKKILQKNNVDIDISDDIVAILNTFSIGPAADVVLPYPDRSCLASILLICLANKIEDVGSLLNREVPGGGQSIRENILLSSGVGNFEIGELLKLFYHH